MASYKYIIVITNQSGKNHSTGAAIAKLLCGLRRIRTQHRFSTQNHVVHSIIIENEQTDVLSDHHSTRIGPTRNASASRFLMSRN